MIDCVDKITLMFYLEMKKFWAGLKVTLTPLNGPTNKKPKCQIHQMSHSRKNAVTPQPCRPQAVRCPRGHANSINFELIKLRLAIFGSLYWPLAHRSACSVWCQNMCGMRCEPAREYLLGCLGFFTVFIPEFFCCVFAFF